MNRNELQADLQHAKGQLTNYDRMLELLRPHMEGTDRTLADALSAMSEAERAEVVDLLWLLDERPTLTDAS